MEDQGNSLERILRQHRAFELATIECDGCHTQAPLSRVQPVLREDAAFMCVRCVRELPYDDFLAILRGNLEKGLT